MNASEKLSAPVREAEHYNQTDPSANVRKTLDTTSKLVHPTAFAVLGSPEEGELGTMLKKILFTTGVRYGVEAFNEMKDYVAKNGVEPPP